MKKRFILTGIAMLLLVSMAGCLSEQIKPSPRPITTSTPQNTQTVNVTPIWPIEGTRPVSFWVSETVSNYRGAFVDAVDTNNFNQLSNFLIPNSEIYNSQKKLVSELYEKGIKEEKIKVDIKYSPRVLDYGIYKVYVTETIGIKYPDKQDYEIKDFHWIYTVEASKDNIGISNIEEWSTYPEVPKPKY